MTDPISDMLARIRNAVLVKKPTVAVPYSLVKARMADILVKEGYVAAVREEAQPYRMLVMELKYDGGQPAIRSLKRISKPGQRHYVKTAELPRVLSGLGIAIISTSKGLMTNREAKEQRLGGEVLCEIY